MLGLGPDEFYAMLPAHFFLLVDTARRKAKRERFFMAAMTANIMNATGALRRPVTPQQLLGIKETPVRHYSKAERAAKLADAMKKVTVES